MSVLSDKEASELFKKLNSKKLAPTETSKEIIRFEAIVNHYKAQDPNDNTMTEIINPATSEVEVTSVKPPPAFTWNDSMQ